jgi:tetratricopeptide (TPR) repeat protein
LLALVATLLAVAIGELAVRVLGLAPAAHPIPVSADDSPYQRSRNTVLGYELRPGYQGQDGHGQITVNRDGLRDPERAIPQPPDTRRIVILGDSVLEAIGFLADPDTIASQLEGLLVDRPSEVINLGMTGYCTRAEVELLEVRGLKYEPDLVILLFVENDFLNFNLEAVPLTDRIARPAVVTAAFLASHLFRLTCLRLDLYGFGQEADPAAWNRRATGDNNVADGLRRLSELRLEHGFEVVVAIWPMFEDHEIVDRHYMPDASDQLVVERLARLYDLDTYRLSDSFRHHWQSHGKEASPRATYTCGDGMHPSPVGAQVAAESLHDVVTDAARASSGPQATAAGVHRVDDDAVRAAAALGERFSSDALALLHRGMALRQEGRLGEAITVLRQAADLRSRVRWVRKASYVNLADALLEWGEVEAAVEACRRAVMADASDADVHHLLAVCLGRLGRTGEAVDSFRRTLELDPRHVDARRNLALAYRSQGRPEQAVLELRELVRQRPGYADAHAELADTLHRTGHFDEAIHSYRQAIALDPARAATHCNLGVALSAAGELDQAVHHFREATRLDPGNPILQRNLDQALARVTATAVE